MEFSNDISMEISPFSSLRNHDLGLEAVQFNPTNPSEMMTASHDKSICFWDLNKLAPIQKIDCKR